MAQRAPRAHIHSDTIYGEMILHLNFRLFSYVLYRSTDFFSFRCLLSTTLTNLVYFFLRQNKKKKKHIHKTNGLQLKMATI